MKRPEPIQLIDIDALRVGMLVHLDGGWMSHPFPLNTFRIASTEQIDTLRSLGMRQVRCSPHPGEAGSGPAETAGTAQAVRAASAASCTQSSRPAMSVSGTTGGPAPAPDPRGLLPGDKRDASPACERRFRAAGRACKQALDAVTMKPEQARRQTEALANSLLETMLSADEIRVRLMVDSAEDRASNHALNVMVLSMLMGRSLGFSDAELLDLGVGAMLHDMGKAEMPLRVRHRWNDFTAAEHRDYEEHVAHGLAQARRMGLSAGATLVIAQHHELADGSGFPMRLKAERIASRVVAIVDRYDNLCNPHLQARGLNPHEAVSWLFAHGKDKYETSLLNGFIRMMGVYPPGSLVQLTDDRHALVLSVHSGRPLKPQVLVHEPARRREDRVPLDLDRTDGLGIRRSIKAAQLPPAALEFLAPPERVSYSFESAREAEPVC